MKRTIKFGSLFVAILLVFGILANLTSAYAAVPGTNVLVSVNNTGNGQGGNANSPHSSGNPTSTNSEVSADGRFVAFTSNASNLVANDTNNKTDVFVRDLVNNTTARVNVSSTGVQADNGYVAVSADHVAISSTGRYVVFDSTATNLIDGRTITGSGQVYMRDTLTGTTSVVTQRSDGTLGNGGFNNMGGVSDDGRFVTWVGSLDTNLQSTETTTGTYYVYLMDMKTRTLSVLNHTSEVGQFFVSGIASSCNGSFVSFGTKLKLDTNDTDSSEDVYLVDVRNGYSVSGISTSSNATKVALAPSLSCNGRFLTFRSNDTALSTSLSPTDTKDHQFLYDRVDGSIALVDTSSTGVVGNGSASWRSAVDDKGNVAFTSNSTNLIDGSTTSTGQVYLKYKSNGGTEVASKTSSGAKSNGAGGDTTISADGKTVVYSVYANTNLLSSDTNGFTDIIASATGL